MAHIFINRLKKQAYTLGYAQLTTQQTVIPFMTIEPPDKNNQHNVSCIPDGIYQAVLIQQSQKHNYPHLLLLHVTDRSGIEMHIGNTVQDTEGCILAGQSINYLTETAAALCNSTQTIKRIMQAIKTEQDLDPKSTIFISIESYV